MSRSVDVDEDVMKITKSLKRIDRQAHYAGPDAEREVLKLVEGIQQVAVTRNITTSIAAQMDHFKEQLNDAVSDTHKSACSTLALRAAEAKTAIIKAGQKLQQDKVAALDAAANARESLSELVVKAQESTANAVRAIQDERLKALDSIGLYVGNATRSVPTLPDLIQAVSSLHTIIPSPPAIVAPSTAQVDDLLRRMAAVEASTAQNQTYIDQLVDAKVSAALAKQGQEDRHHQELQKEDTGSPVEPVCDKADAERTQAAVTKKEHLEDQEVDESEDINYISRTFFDAFVKQDERYLRIVQSLRVDLEECKTSVRAAETKSAEAFIRQEERHHETILFLQAELQAYKLEIQTYHKESNDQKRLAEDGLRVIRHDILDLAHSFIEIKFAIQSSVRVDPQGRSVNGLVDNIEDKLTALTKVSDLKYDIFGPTLPPSTARFTGVPAPVHDLNDGMEGVDEDDFANTSGCEYDYTDLSASISLISGFCGKEPNRSDLPIAAPNPMVPPRVESHSKDRDQEKLDDYNDLPSPTPSSIFDNNGPLSLDQADLRALLRAALLCNKAVGVSIIKSLSTHVPTDMTSESDDDPPQEFGDLYDQYCRQITGGVVIHEPKDAALIWASFMYLMDDFIEEHAVKSSAQEPPIWEGAGLPGHHLRSRLAGPKGNKRAKGKKRGMRYSKAGDDWYPS